MRRKWLSVVQRAALSLIAVSFGVFILHLAKLAGLFQVGAEGTFEPIVPGFFEDMALILAAATVFGYCASRWTGRGAAPMLSVVPIMAGTLIAMPAASQLARELLASPDGSIAVACVLVVPLCAGMGALYGLCLTVRMGAASDETAPKIGGKGVTVVGLLVAIVMTILSALLSVEYDVADHSRFVDEYIASATAPFETAEEQPITGERTPSVPKGFEKKPCPLCGQDILIGEGSYDMLVADSERDWVAVESHDGIDYDMTITLLAAVLWTLIIASYAVHERIVHRRAVAPR